MYAKFRLLLTLLVFVNINMLACSNDSITKATNSNTQRLALPSETEKEPQEIETSSTLIDEATTTTLPLSDEEEEEVVLSGEDELITQARSFAENHADDSDSTRPLKNMLRGIYKSYKSTYMGNGTSAEYKKRLIARLNAAAAISTHSTTTHTTTTTTQPKTMQQNEEITKNNERLKQQTSLITSTETDASPLSMPHATPSALEGEAFKVKLNEKQLKRKRKNKRVRSSANKRAKLSQHLNIVSDESNENVQSNNSSHSRNSTLVSSSGGGISVQPFNDDELHDKHYRYTIGPGVNMSFDMPNDIVNVNLDGDNLREIMRGRWLSDNTEEGRGKKYDMVTKVLPLFVLPFLIQSAIVPFLVTKLKLLLIKSILVGKLAIFLLIISAIKNSNNKMVQSYEVAPSYWAGEPSRRSELAAAAATSAAYNGYRVEGKPAAWIN